MADPRLALLLLVAGCVPDPRRGPDAPSVPPDEAFLVDDLSHTTRVLLWDCVDDERVAMLLDCGLLCQHAWTVRRDACGSRGWWDDVPEDRRGPLPEGTGW